MIQGLLGVVLDVVDLVPQVLDAVVDGLAPKPNCALKNETQYYIQSTDGRFAVVDVNKQLAFLKQVSADNASKFTTVQKTCEVYGLCVNGFCMSRCAGCSSDTGDFQTVKFHTDNSDGTYSQWTLTPPGGVVGGPYNLQVESYYLTYKQTQNGDDQLTLSTELNDETTFSLIEVN